MSCVQVNPVIPETVNQIAFQVVGQDLTVTMASESGQLQLNVFEPVMACECSSSFSPGVFVSFERLKQKQRLSLHLCKLHERLTKEAAQTRS